MIYVELITRVEVLQSIFMSMTRSQGSYHNSFPSEDFFSGVNSRSYWKSIIRKSSAADSVILNIWEEDGCLGNLHNKKWSI